MFLAVLGRILGVMVKCN